MAKFRNVTKMHMAMMLECNLELSGRVFLLVNAKESTCKTVLLDTRMCGVYSPRSIGYMSTAAILVVCGLE